ncbi:MAG: hypothetical protein HY474_00850 [Candidatus Sungbacteria bacterium]|uniref:Uncharacterized protein n=1 Tax=Candidatus Sungiibacteriota bacterium TaxID=2750080 RepID=A0A933DSS5_9BACT|nr:hypothetical protein [Candidatus Sungbacteria bacterium]
MRLTNIIKTEEIERRLEALPDDLEKAFEDERTGRIIFEAGRKLGLPIDQVGEVVELVGYAMLGFVKASDLLTHLTEITGDSKKADELGTAINQNIFLPIRDALKRAYGNQWTDTPAATPMPPPVAVQPPPPPKLEQPAPQAAMPKKPEPLIIHPLPSRPRETGDSGERVAGNGQRIADIRPEKLPLPPPAAKPAPVPAAPAPRPSAAPTQPPPKPVEKSEATKPPVTPPIISPLGTRTTMPTVQPKPETPKVEPPAPSRVEGPPPPPPSSAYDRAKAAMEKELAALQRPQPAATAKPPKEDSGQRIADSGPGVLPAVPTTKELLQREIEKFRQPAVDSQQHMADSIKKSPPSTPAPKPLKLPQEKIPKPPAPDKYEVDPYKESPE